MRVPRVALLLRGRVRAAPALPRRRPASPAAEEPDAWGGWFRHAAFPAEDLLGIAADGRGGGSSAAAAAPPPYDLADFRYQEASSGRNRALLYWEEVVEAATAVPGGEENRAAASLLLLRVAARLERPRFFMGVAKLKIAPGALLFR